ncbi:oligogalacturonate-specific porin KdgM family protein [Vibrio splendidus]|uniref:oligogalacturonate-specific porin KdgM family protein n=1 Tax=Vibrio splendidus TaxID=29497 RepID=UPI0007F97BE5|nr:oligogalacturonate-specific porin KdgM family protein [Vibrio splendidus]NOI91756.1 N-acetylneuraminic acid outer membrane channel protein NanC [Vibrio splendidus]OBT32269.1 N-acetylneuraminic acid outer membrane channel protein NanC [Vibrio splendidus]
MNKTKIVIAVASVLAAGSVSAASFDMRHEYKSHTDQHATRVKLGDSIGNFLVDIEAKFKGEDGKFMEDLKNNGWELGLNYRHVLNDNWTMTYGMPIEGRESGVTYKPQVRATYKLDSIDGLSLSARYRYDMRQNTSSSEYQFDSNGDVIVDSDGVPITVDKNVSNQRRHRLTANVNYSMENWRFGLEGNYYKADGYDIYDNDDTNYELNASIRHMMGQWAPYVEFGDVSTSSTKATRELRSRVGLTYSF